jgi:replicative DNA helicase
LLAAPQGVVASPWGRLNERINGGMRPGELWIVAARPSVGKTTVVLQWALSACAAGQRVLFVSLEMSKWDLFKRVLAAQGSISHSLLVRGDPDAARRRRVAETLAHIGDYRIEITDKLRKLRTILAHVAAARPAFDLVVVDYLGLIESGSRYQNRNEEVSALSRQMKIAAMDSDVPILCAHSSPAPTKRKTGGPNFPTYAIPAAWNKMPTQSSCLMLRRSGNLENSLRTL